MANISFPAPSGPTSVVFPRILAHVLSELDASGMDTASWPDTSDDDAFSIDWVRYNISTAAGALAELLLTADPPHPSAGDFLVSTGPHAHGDLLPNYIGNPGSAYVSISGSAPFTLAHVREIDMIQMMRRRGIVLADYYYGIDLSGRIYFTGALPTAGAERINIDLGTFDVATGTFWDGLTLSCQDWIACRALSRLFAQAGDNLGPASYFLQLWNELVASVRGKAPMPAFPHRAAE